VVTAAERWAALGPGAQRNVVDALRHAATRKWWQRWFQSSDCTGMVEETFRADLDLAIEVLDEAAR
jgi:hypothetical protein